LDFHFGPSKSFLKALFKIHFGILGPLKIGGPRQMSTFPMGKDGSESTFNLPCPWKIGISVFYTRLLIEKVTGI